MFAKLKGIVTDVFSDFLILEVGDIGYRVETVERSFLVGQQVDLYIYTHVRENEIRLFGLSNKQQYMLFTDLIEVSGVGPKMALTILSQLSYEEILTAIETKTPQALKVKGVGAKTAQRIVIDMSSKLEKYSWVKGEVGATYHEEFISQTKDALQNLGFNHTEITSILKEYAQQQQPEKLEMVVKFALKYIKNK